MEKILLDSLYGEVQNAKGYRLLLRKTSVWMCGVSVWTQIGVLFLYTQKIFGWVKIGGDSHQAISGIACSLCTLNQDSLKNKMKLRFFSFCFSGCMIITPDLLNREIQWLVCFLCESWPPFYFWICYCFSNEYNYKISHAVLQKSCVKSSIKSQI